MINPVSPRWEDYTYDDYLNKLEREKKKKEREIENDYPDEEKDMENVFINKYKKHL